MKKISKLLLLAAMLSCCFTARAVFVTNMPVNRIQPNGDTIHLFVTGDEYYHRYHDADNYTIVMNQQGYWVYAVPDNNGGIQPSAYVVGTAAPAAIGIQPGLTISRSEWDSLRKAWEIPEQYRITQPKTSGRNNGDYCNLVIFVRFADDSNYSRTLSSINAMFSDSSSVSSNSVYNYFKHASYNKLHVRTYYAPAPDGDIIRSYQSPHPRCYYMPYSENNPRGYHANERANREFELITNAVQFINDSFPVPSNIVLDNDGDGQIDNVNLVVRGSYTGWSDLLWPHKWNLYGRNCYINGKLINTFNFALEGAGGDYFGTSTFCHEMFHSLGAPDLYHYYTETEVSPAGSWDIMQSSTNPPQHMNAFMKWRYGNWLDSIPTLTTPGTYRINSLGDSVPTNNCYKIPSCDPDQYYVIEFRDNTKEFETAIPNKGLLVWRIDQRYEGNAGYDDNNNLDGVWLFRPGSTSRHENGIIGMAAFDTRLNRPAFTPGTDPFPYLNDGTRDLGFAITNIRQMGRQLTFRFTNRTAPVDLHYTNATSSTITLNWRGIGEAYRLYYRRADSDSDFVIRTIQNTHITLSGLEPSTIYEWKICALYSSNGNGTYADSSDITPLATFHTELCNFTQLDTITDNSYTKLTGVPFVNNSKYTYSQQIFYADEIGSAKSISAIRFHYAHSTPLSKTNCTIYLGNTDRMDFIPRDSHVTFDSLTMVYTGDMHFEMGWNEFVFSTPFHHNGVSNLVLAVDDNSGILSHPGEKFYCNRTERYASVSYSSSDNQNPDPSQDSIIGSRAKNTYRNDIQFTSCPDLDGQVYLCVLSDNDDAGYVLGSSLYNNGDSAIICAFPYSGYTFREWNDGSTINPRSLIVTQDTLFIAYFNSPVGIRETSAEAGFLVATRGLDITVIQADLKTISIYDITGRRIAEVGAQHEAQPCFRMPSAGIYLIKVGTDKPRKIIVR